MPVLAKPMVAVTNTLVDDGFMLSELNDEELIKIIGQVILAPILGLDPGKIIIIEKNEDHLIFICTDYYYNENGSYIQVTWYFENGVVKIIDMDYYPPVHPKT